MPLARKLILLVVLMFAGSAARAQTRDPQIGQYVRIHRENRVTSGTVSRVTADSITVEVERGLGLTIARASITRLELLRGKLEPDVIGGDGVLAGAQQGAMVGAGAAVLLCAASDSGCKQGSRMLWPAILVVAGAALLGAAMSVSP